FGDDGRLIARVEGGGVHRLAIRRRGEGARRVGEEGELREALATGRGAELVRVEYPHVGAPHAGGEELRIVGGRLPAVRGRDEGAALVRPGEDDVARLVADEERPHDARVLFVAYVDDAHRIGEVIDDPHFVVGARGDGHWLEADLDRGDGA